MELYIERDDKTLQIEIAKPTPIKEILQQNSISLESVILVKNDGICLEDELVENKDSIKLLSVISGG